MHDWRLIYSNRAVTAIFLIISDQFIKVEQASFTPLVFATTGGMEKEAMAFTDAWPAYCLTAIWLRTAVPWHGWGAHSLFLCCDLLQCASVEAGPSRSVMPEMGHLDGHRNYWVPLFLFFSCPVHANWCWGWWKGQTI